MNNTFITFIIPSIGRNSLINSIYSLIDQEDSNWKAIIILDGVKKKEDWDKIDNRLTIIEIEKIENQKSAGLVRNIGLSLVSEDSEWIGFLDDDDIITNDYISKLKEEININPKMEVCLFRMAYSNGCILPNRDLRNITIGKVGISFALKKDITELVKFKNSLGEDYFYLKELQLKKYKIIISPFTTYFIKNNNTFICNIYPKILINFD